MTAFIQCTACCFRKSMYGPCRSSISNNTHRNAAVRLAHILPNLGSVRPGSLQDQGILQDCVWLLSLMAMRTCTAPSLQPDAPHPCHCRCSQASPPASQTAGHAAHVIIDGTTLRAGCMHKLSGPVSTQMATQATPWQSH